MDPRISVNRDEFYNVQMDLRQIQAMQSNYNERLQRIERRQQDDASIKSVWNNPPFPAALSGTPQHGASSSGCHPPAAEKLTHSPGPVHMPSHDHFDFQDVDQALPPLHLETEDEPLRRGTASRAASVRFDESANWGQSTRHSGDFGPIRPGSGLAMERSLSHKSDGRHSSTGHSVHSNHSMASGRGSSLGLDTSLGFGGLGEDSPLEMPDPPPGLFVLGPVPAIVRCWLTTDFANDTLLYAAICSGARQSTLEGSLVEELGLLNDVYRDAEGAQRIRLPVYLAEAIVSQSSSRSPNPIPQIPSISTNFEIVKGERFSESSDGKKAIRVFIGSDTLRAQNADLLFSRNQMSLYSNDRDRLAVPFVRPEDDFVYKHLATSHLVPGRPKLNAAAAEFVLGETKTAERTVGADAQPGSVPAQDETTRQELVSPTTNGPTHPPSDNDEDSETAPRHSTSSEHSGKDAVLTPDGTRREASAIWGSWRQGGGSAGAGGDGSRGENPPLSGYQPAGRPRPMKVLGAKPKPGTPALARMGAPYEPAPAPPRSSSELRRKSQAGSENGAASHSIRWESKRSLNSGHSAGGGGGPNRENKPQGLAMHDLRNVTPMPRTANPVGGASAFAWMNPAKAKTTATAE